MDLPPKLDNGLMLTDSGTDMMTAESSYVLINVSKICNKFIFTVGEATRSTSGLRGLGG